MPKMTIEDITVQNKRVLMRVDFNVPIKGGKVANDKRIREALPTIRHILQNGGRLILMSHLGRPKGEKKAEFSLAPCAEALSGLLGQKVTFVPDCVGDPARTAVGQLKSGNMLLLENLRYYKAEEKNDPAFAKQLAELGDIYVNDAFGTAHRAHASTEGVTHYIQPSVAGFLMTKELDYLGRVIQAPQHPFVAILGGAKISGKIDVIQNLLSKVDRLIIGGGMVFTFLRAKGLEVGRSLVEEDRIALAGELLAVAGDKILLPVDCQISSDYDIAAGRIAQLRPVRTENIPGDAAGLDIGPASIEAFRDALAGARTIVWNGPMGVFEIQDTAKGTFQMAQVLAQLTAQGAVTVIGGGDSAAAAEKAGVADRISHISTGGGASLEYLEGKTLPGVAALTER
jgi:phosphoglycerate kinase